MASNKNFFLKLIIFAALIFPTPFLRAQVKGNISDTEPHFIRRLSWNEDSYALRYEVIIEKEEEGKYLVFLREFTSDSSLEVSFPPGQYRCRVIPYDYLEKPGEGSRWMSFEVRSVADQGLPPTDNLEIVTVSPEPVPPAEKNKLPRLFDFYLGAAWMPLIPLYGGSNQFFIRKISPAGAGLRFGAILSKESFLNIGAELAGSWYTSRALLDGNEETIHAVSLDLNFLARKWFPGGITALTFRLGVGYTFVPAASLSAKESVHTNLGISFIWLFTKQFYLETGLDYTHLFTEDPSGCFRPWIGMGWRF